jgi:hypothetical protein
MSHKKIDRRGQAGGRGNGKGTNVVLFLEPDYITEPPFLQCHRSDREGGER